MQKPHPSKMRPCSSEGQAGLRGVCRGERRGRGITSTERLGGRRRAPVGGGKAWVTVAGGDGLLCEGEES